jgi:hypothetical protein
VQGLYYTYKLKQGVGMVTEEQRAEFEKSVCSSCPVWVEDRAAILYGDPQPAEGHCPCEVDDIEALEMDGGEVICKYVEWGC